MLQEFSYLSPATKEELLGIIWEKKDKARLLAGGTDLFVDIRSGIIKPELVVDIKRIEEFSKIQYKENEGLSIGPAVKCIDIINNAAVKERFPLLKEAASQIGSLQIRNRATIVGNICTASPSANISPALLCLDASVEITSKNESRKIKLQDFFLNVKKTVLLHSEIVERIVVPDTFAYAGGGMEELKRVRGHDISTVSVALIKKERLIRVAIGACNVTAILLKDFDIDTSVDVICKEAENAMKPIDDIRASKDYRIFMVMTFIKRLIERVRS